MKLTSERLELNPMQRSDVDKLFDLDQRPEVMTYIKANTPTFEDAIRKNERYVFYGEKNPGLSAFVVTLKDTQEFIGFGFLVDIELNPKHQKVEVGYRFYPQHWGKGYASEVTQTLLKYGFNTLNLPAIYGTTDPDNLVSMKVLEKAGLKKMGMCEYHAGSNLFKMENPGQKT